MTVHARLAAANLTLPTPQLQGGAYKPAIIAGDLLSLPAQFPIVEGRAAVVGRLGDDLTTEQGYHAARLAALNALARINHTLGGFDRLVQIIHVSGILLTTPDFTDHARVMDGASDLLNLALADKAGHTRSLQGAASLPGRLPVQLVITAQIRPA